MNKYLITVIIPTAEMEFDIFIPNGKKVGAVKKFILEALKDLTDNVYSKAIDEVRMIDRKTSIEYDNNLYVKDTNIKNGTKLVVI